MLTKEAVILYKRWVLKNKGYEILEQNLQMLHECFKSLIDLERNDMFNNDFYMYLDWNLKNKIVLFGKEY